jgi:branched-chain amino acid transport system substrate-binding protein
MMKRLFFLCTLCVCWLPFTVANAKNACLAASGDPLRLGAIFPPGSLLTVQNVEYFWGAQAMQKAVNDCGGVNGRPVEWVYVPAADREDAAQAAQHLIDDEKVALIVGSGSQAVSEGASEVAQKAGVVYWEVTESIPAGGGWLFSPRPTYAQVGELTVQFIDSALSLALNREIARVALVYEDRPRGAEVAASLRQPLGVRVAIDYGYRDELYNAYALAVDIREKKVDAVVLAAFDSDGNRLWYALREADANIGAWIHIGSEGYPRGLCQQMGNIDGFLSVDVAGSVSEMYRAKTLGSLYDHYRQAYVSAHGRQPSQLADLTASGVYLLLHHILPQVEGDYTAQSVRDAISSADIPPESSLMGEGFAVLPESWLNKNASVVISQEQKDQFCSVYPGAIATCSGSVQPFPTWRDRALAEERHNACDPHT